MKVKTVNIDEKTVIYSCVGAKREVLFLWESGGSAIIVKTVDGKVCKFLGSPTPEQLAECKRLAVSILAGKVMEREKDMHILEGVTAAGEEYMAFFNEKNVAVGYKSGISFEINPSGDLYAILGSPTPEQLAECKKLGASILAHSLIADGGSDAVPGYIGPGPVTVPTSRPSTRADGGGSGDGVDEEAVVDAASVVVPSATPMPAVWDVANHTAELLPSLAGLASIDTPFSM
jgi:hypothetical protein